MTFVRSLLLGLGRAATARPRTAIALWGVFALLAGLATARIQPSGSLDAVLTEGPASQALARVINGFGVVDNLIVLVTADPDDADPRGRLAQFAARFEAEIRESPTLAPRCAEVAYGPMPEIVAFIQEHVVPAALWLVDDETLAAVRTRVTPDGIREQIRRDEELIATPSAAGGGMAKSILRDPLRLYEVLLPAFADRLPAFQPLEREPLHLSRDGRTLLIRVVGTRPASDLPFAKALVADVAALSERLADGGLTIEYTGAYAIATTAERAIRADLIGTITGSITLLFLLFMLVHRRAASFALAIAPVGVGIVGAFGLGSFIFPGLTPAAGAIGAVLAGLSVDYSIHFLSHFSRDLRATRDARAAIGTTLEHVAPAMAMACVTSLIGFLAIAQSSVPALRQFAWLGLFGLSGALLATITLLPALLLVSVGRGRGVFLDRPSRPLIGPIARWAAAHPLGCAGPLLVVAAIGGAGALLSPGELLPLEHDLTVMHPRPNRPLALQHALPDRFGFDPDSLLVYLHADDGDTLLRTAHRVDRALRTAAAREVGVIGAFGPASLLADPAQAEARGAALQRINPAAVVDDFQAALADSLFNPEAFAGYAEFLRRFLSAPPPPTWEDLAEHPDVARLMLPTREPAAAGGPREALVVVFSDRARTDRAQRDAAIETLRGLLADIDGAALTGVSVVGYDTEHRVRGDLARLLGVALVLVVGCLVVYFRSVTAGLLALLPSLFGLLCLGELAEVLGLRLNMVNLIGAPILIGMGVDAGIFLVSLAAAARREGATLATLTERLIAGCEAVTLSTLTTVVSFGTLALTSTPAIRSLGVTLAVAMAATLVGAVLLLVPVLTWRHARTAGRSSAG
jgi:predicted RND superfamily exporter protein